MSSILSTLVEQAELILKKCEGLPLAIVTIGGFLANQSKTASEWRTLNDHISAELEMNAELETIRAILVKSYDGLPYHLKSCFLYLSLFPEDYKVSRGRLVRRWIAEGYSKEVRGKSAEDMADSYFMDLISRSMILPSQKSIYSRKGVDSCQVHDLIREIDISKSTEENLAFILEEGCNLNSQGPIRHLGVSNNWEGDRDELESMVDMSRLRSLTMFWRGWKPCFISDKMRLLRVLDMENMHLAVSNRQLKRIGKFRHLRYLSVRGCDNITLLPASLGKLRHLQTLDARDTNIMKLPKTILNLRELNYLSVGQKSYLDEEDGREDLPEVIRSRACIFTMICCLCCINCCISPLSCKSICTRYCCEELPVVMCHDVDLGGALVPSGIHRLKTLHKLGVVNIAEGKTILEDIQRLTQLRKLGVTGINKKNAQGFCSAISGLNCLESLSMRSVGKPGLSSCMDGTSSPPENVQSLKLLGNLVKLPEWIHGLKNLMKLKLRSSRILEHNTAIQVLGELPKLAILRLMKDSCGGEEVCFSFHERTFPSLVVLELDDVGKLKSVKFEQGAAPMLELLQVNHGELYKVDVEIYSGIPSLPRLKEVTIKAPNCEDGFMEELRAQLDRNPNRPLLKAD